MKKLLIIFLFFTFLGCNGKHIKEKGNCEAVFYHEYNRYSAAIKEGNNIYIKQFPWPIFISVEIIQDVKKDESLWYETNYYDSEWIGYHGDENSFIRIHIRSITDITGADWNHGKFGRGSTIKLQEN